MCVITLIDSNQLTLLYYLLLLQFASSFPCHHRHHHRCFSVFFSFCGRFKTTKNEMSIIVYAQTTNWNERLCSLLSSVLQRSMRPSFTHAILEKPRRLRTPNNNNNWNSHRTSSTSNSSRRRSRTEPSSPKIVKIVCVGTLPSERIVSMIPDFRLRYGLKVCVLSSRDEQTIQ